MIKQRKDSYEQFVAQNRNDLAEGRIGTNESD